MTRFWNYLVLSQQRIVNMSKDNYEENDERMNIIGQNGNDGLHYGKIGESVITDIYVGKYVLVQLVDETVELTVQNNVYSLTESVELQQDLLKALHELTTQNILPEIMIKDIKNGS